MLNSSLIHKCTYHLSKLDTGPQHLIEPAAASVGLCCTVKGVSIGQKPLLLCPCTIFCLIQELAQVEYGGCWGAASGSSPLLGPSPSLLACLLALLSVTTSFPTVRGRSWGHHRKSTSSTSYGSNSSNHASTWLGSAAELLQADAHITIMSESGHSAWSQEIAPYLLEGLYSSPALASPPAYVAAASLGLSQSCVLQAMSPDMSQGQ